MRNLRAAFKLSILLSVTLAMLPWGLLAHSLAKDKLRTGRRWTRLWCRFAWRLLGGHVEVVGEPLPTGGGMVIANHMSYLDIMLHGSLLGMRFAPAAEMKKWLIVGPMTRVTNPVWIYRSQRRRSGVAVHEMNEALRGEVPLLVYPEGTNGDGSELLPFKTTCFESAIEVNCAIYPLVTRYMPTADGTPLPWVGHCNMWSHFWRVLGLKEFHCKLCVLPTVRPEGYDRKTLRKHLRDSMSECLHKLNAEEWPPRTEK